jgi:glycosyltransferase involved in cell wall biosynthesis
LIYGGYGSTAVECLALGKPVVCYVRDSWKDFLIRQFPEWKDCPIVSATPESIEMELKKLVENQLLREHIGRESRRFAEGFLDARKNVIEFEQVLISLSIEKTH